MSSKVIQGKTAYKTIMTQDTAANPRPISWYRTPLDTQTFKSLHQKSDFLGLLQTLGYLSVLAVPGALAMYGLGRWPIGVVLLLVFVYGTIASFMPNAVHELGHGTVFRTKFLNQFFLQLISFLNWNNYEYFNTSHTRHHRYTLHQPDDLEVTLPAKVLMRHMILKGIINPMGIPWTIRQTIRIACGRFEGEWELKLFRKGTPEREAAMKWARFMLAGHAAVFVVSMYFHLWLLPVLISCNGYGAYGSWLHNLCNNTQHIGLQDDVPDFRLCCRTFTVNPFVQFLYWHMNYHIEHHMYAAVPCYHLGKLHQLIKHDLPPCSHGLVETWKEITSIMKRQEADPKYQYVAPLPNVARENTGSIGLSPARA